ncbi:Homeobox-leucine zipper protein ANTHOCYANINLESS 2 [Ananas comosus]|uniref:Homeobox-leucine zipper protein ANTHOCYANINLESS 2 n=1 Tax=Ananas comosus TaxID=4615 RepID=A0A199VM99_ANACO|nr:Homeobox-leucine zipper protein ANTHOCYANINLESS 2 [Ananas comosus]
MNRMELWASEAQRRQSGERDGDSMGRNKEDENESRSGGATTWTEPPNPRKKKRYHATPSANPRARIECPHPDEKQRLELSKRLAGKSASEVLVPKQTHPNEAPENALLRQENDKLRAENLTIREAMRNPICTTAAARMLARSRWRSSTSGSRTRASRTSSTLPRPPDLRPRQPHPSDAEFLAGARRRHQRLRRPRLRRPHALRIPDFVPSAMVGPITPPPTAHRMLDGSFERSVFLELALAAMEELVKMAQMEEPLWIPTFDGTAETLNYDEYRSTFPRIIGPRPSGYVSEATREMGMVIINSVALVETLMDAVQSLGRYVPMHDRENKHDEAISSGVGGTRNGALQLVSS